MVMVVRTESDPLGYVGPIKEALHKIDPDQPVASIKPMTAYLAQSIAQRRFNMLLLAIFAGLALLLAAVGIYGVIAYSVTQRKREVGIRIALGAQPGDVIRLIVRQGMRPAFLGLLAGLLAAIGLTRFMASLLFQVNAIDPLVFGLVGVVLMLVAALACFLPARRALHLDPAITLREE
jgi:putative ABC transport system permease protein